jgi:hypothetical protein
MLSKGNKSLYEDDIFIAIFKKRKVPTCMPSVDTSASAPTGDSRACKNIMAETLSREVERETLETAEFESHPCENLLADTGAIEMQMSNLYNIAATESIEAVVSPLYPSSPILPTTSSSICLTPVSSPIQNKDADRESGYQSSQVNSSLTVTIPKAVARDDDCLLSPLSANDVTSPRIRKRKREKIFDYEDIPVDKYNCTGKNCRKCYNNTNCKSYIRSLEHKLNYFKTYMSCGKMKKFRGRIPLYMVREFRDMHALQKILHAFFPCFVYDIEAPEATLKEYFLLHKEWGIAIHSE